MVTESLAVQNLLLSKLEALVLELDFEIKTKREHILRPGCFKPGDNLTGLSEKQCKAARGCFEGLLPSLRKMVYPESKANELINFDYVNGSIKIPKFAELKDTLVNLQKSPHSIIARAAHALVNAIDGVTELERQKKEAQSQIAALKRLLN